MSPRRQPDPWPRPADTPLDRARQIARNYRRALLIAAPDTCAALDKESVRLGQGWIMPRPDPYEPLDLLTATLVADFWHVRVRTVDRWRETGLRSVSTPDGPRYRFVDVEEFLGTRRSNRTG